MGTKFKFEEVQERLNLMKLTLPVLMANQARTFFVNSFKEQGWEGHQWKPSNKKTGSTLVKSGALRRAVNNSIRTKTFDKVQLLVDLPYAARHNEGLDGMPQRQFIGQSPTLTGKQIDLIDKAMNKVWLVS